MTNYLNEIAQQNHVRNNQLITREKIIDINSGWVDREKLVPDSRRCGNDRVKAGAGVALVARHEPGNDAQQEGGQVGLAKELPRQVLVSVKDDGAAPPCELEADGHQLRIVQVKDGGPGCDGGSGDGTGGADHPAKAAAVVRTDVCDLDSTARLITLPVGNNKVDGVTRRRQ